MNTHKLYIQQILEKYWAGESSLKEEKELRHYFSESNDIDDAHGDLQTYFAGLESQPKSSMSDEFTIQFWLDKASVIPTGMKFLAFRKWAVAASFLLLVGLGIHFYNQSNNQQRESTVATTEEGLEEAQKAIRFLAEHFKKGQDASIGIKHIKTLGSTLN